MRIRPAAIKTNDMFNNVALDVFIGLIFIYLLYSLLATAINEFIATLFAYRHRMLEKAIEQMLDGKSYSYYWWDKLMNILLWIYQGATDLFSSGKGKSVGLMAFISNEKLPSGPTRSVILPMRRVKLNSKARLFASKVINHPLYRRKAEHSILFRKPAYLNAETFSDILTDLFTRGQSGANSTPVFLNDIRDFVNTELKDNPDLRRIINIYLEQANGDIQKFRLLLERWFDDTMERVTGWYKRQANKVLMLIGFTLALIFNVSTINIVARLSVDKAAREAMVQNASQYVKTHLVDSVRSASDSTASHSAPPDDEYKQAGEKLSAIRNLYDSSIAQDNSIMGLGWEGYGYTRDTNDFKKKYSLSNYDLIRDIIEDRVRDTSNYKQLHAIANYQTYSEALKKKYPDHPQTPGALEKLWWVLSKTFSQWRLLFGFLITAFAVSLGAPFWFDLLNKFVNLRGAGPRPGEARDSSVSKSSLINSKPDPNSFG